MALKVTGGNDLQRMAKRLAKAPDALHLASVRAVNTAATATRTRIVKNISGHYNLTPEYVKQRTQITKARVSASASAEARIVARQRPTTLARYGARQLVQAAKGNRLKGDALRGIPKGKKSAGVSVEVTRGRRVRGRGFFRIPLKNGNGFGVFSREGDQIKHHYGPSVDQLMRARLSEYSLFARHKFKQNLSKRELQAALQL